MFPVLRSVLRYTSWIVTSSASAIVSSPLVEPAPFRLAMTLQPESLYLSPPHFQSSATLASTGPLTCIMVWSDEDLPGLQTQVLSQIKIPEVISLPLSAR